MLLAALGAVVVAASSVPGSPALQGDAAVLSRLDVIAQDLGRGTADPTAELNEALKLIGFGIWKDKVTSFAPQTSDSPLHLAITDGEIRDYGQMCRMNQGTRLADLEASFDDLVTKLGVKVSVAGAVNAFLADDAWSTKKPVYYLQTFLHDLNSSHRYSPSPSFTADTVLDPVQSLLLMRVISEDICTPVRKHLKAKAKSEFVLARDPNWVLAAMPFAGTNHPAATNALDMSIQASPPLPGWAEDLYVGTIGQIYSAVDAWENQPNSTGSQILSGLTYLNGAMSIIKFVSTYVKLEGDVALTPGPPLVRTTDTLEQGALATLKATFKLNGDASSDTLQSLRTYLALIGGMDLGQPTAAPLKGVETEWVIGQSTKYATQQTIETQRGKSVNLSKVVTDDQGVASVPIAGKPQFNAIDQSTAQKITKHIVIKVTPQVASNNVLGDTINIALGIRSGPAGMLSIVEGFLQHMKWQGTINYDLNVTDWVPGDVYGTLTFDVTATSTNKDFVGPNQQTLSHHLSIENARMKIVGGAGPVQVPSIDPNILKNLTAEQQAQVAAAMAKINGTSTSGSTGASNVRRYLVAGDIGSFKMTIEDSNYEIVEAHTGGEATHGMQSTYGSTIGSSEGSYSPDSMSHPDPTAGYAGFHLEVHPTEGYMLLGIESSCPVTVHNRHYDADQPSQNYNKTNDARFEMMNDIIIDPSALTNGMIKIPYKNASNTPDGAIGGSATVPCTIHNQPASIVISFSMVGKKKS